MVAQESKVEEVRRYLEKYSLDVVCQTFWKGSRMKKRVSSLYQEFLDKSFEMIQSAPPEMRQIANNQREEYIKSKGEECFSRSFLYNYEKELKTLLEASEMLLGSAGIEDIVLAIRKSLLSSSEETMQKVSQVGEMFLAYLLKTFAEGIRNQYISRGISEEKAKCISANGVKQATWRPFVFPSFDNIDD